MFCQQPIQYLKSYLLVVFLCATEHLDSGFAGSDSPDNTAGVGAPAPASMVSALRHKVLHMKI